MRCKGMRTGQANGTIDLGGGQLPSVLWGESGTWSARYRHASAVTLPAVVDVYIMYGPRWCKSGQTHRNTAVRRKHEAAQGLLVTTTRERELRFFQATKKERCNTTNKIRG